MGTESIWERTAADASFPALSGDLEVEVAIIGGGITGITAAHLLSRAGRRVAVLEALSLGQGTTGYSTGNLYATVDNNLYRVRDKWGKETAAAVVRSRMEALQAIEETVRQYSLDCEFVRCPHYFIATEPSHTEPMERELQASLDAGLAASLVETTPLSGLAGRALKLENQAQFQPLAYVRGLAQAIESENCRIYEHSKVTEIDDQTLTLSTPGGTVRAQKLVMATHTPKGFNVVQTELGPYREYGIAARLSDDSYPPPGIFWTFEEPSHSVRVHAAGGERYLVVIGEKHKTGQHGEVDYYGRVEAFARAHFPVREVVCRWSAQHYRPADELPYIGRSAASDDVYIATGFATSGLVYGPLAAAIITDDILGRPNPRSDLYNSKRFTPAKSAGNFLRETADMVGQYLRDYLTPADMEKLEAISPGEGALAEVGGSKCAVYRRVDGEFTVLSPVCPHLGCIVHWNGLEKTWDCPCHGSRFRAEGEVIEGPAISGLERKRRDPHSTDPAA